MHIRPTRHAQFSFHPVDDATSKALIFASQGGDNTAREQLVQSNLRLVWSVVQRFIHRGYEPEDLFQIGCIGLMKAIDKFDFTYAVKFSTYAVPMIIGEIQRFIRDDGTVKVSRSLKEMAHKIRKAKDELAREMEAVPTIQHVAQRLDVTREEVVLAMEATRMPSSIDETVYENEGDPIALIDQLADEQDDRWFERFALSEAIGTLTPRERMIVYLRYYRDQTQAQVAQRLGISQVQVSRLEKKILQYIRTQIAL